MTRRAAKVGYVLRQDRQEEVEAAEIEKICHADKGKVSRCQTKFRCDYEYLPIWPWFG